MKTQCPNCKARFNVDDKFTGKQAKCPKCTKPFTIQPFVEAPAAVTTSTPSPKPVETPVKVAEPVKPVVENPQPATTPVKIPEPAAPTVKAPATIDPPAPVAPPPATPQLVIPVTIAEPAKEVKSVSQPVSKPLKKTRLSKILFVYAWIAIRLIAGGLAGWGLTLALNKGDRSVLFTAFVAVDVFLLISILIELLLFYKMWSAIADNQTSTTPGKAVGFLFIPVFNLYWALNMIMTFAEDYNTFINRRSIKAKDLPPGLFMLYAFAFMLSIVFITLPLLCVFAIISRISAVFTSSYAQVAWLLVGLSAFAGVCHFIAYILSATKTCDAVNTLATEKSD